jgi:prevent-host-death family protein
MVKTITTTEFKAKCLTLIDRVEKKGESYVITKGGQPFVMLVPVSSDDESAGRDAVSQSSADQRRRSKRRLPAKKRS